MLQTHGFTLGDGPVQGQELELDFNNPFKHLIPLFKSPVLSSAPENVSAPQEQRSCRGGSVRRVWGRGAFMPLLVLYSALVSQHMGILVRIPVDFPLSIKCFQRGSFAYPVESYKDKHKIEEWTVTVGCEWLGKEYQAPVLCLMVLSGATNPYQLGVNLSLLPTAMARSAPSLLTLLFPVLLPSACQDIK
ncbi:hypothetical protein DUI87_14679 [Hirundo rustica rustica]|uniref:Uncharacterized protein n=1 Tax=Hirundo rustica rustica TaxID=333673 RepID=A0A3M0K5G1_HIRRU|nr:hypothetical protein DUI87_14679 [Hirundo rustica rustica]